MLNDQIVLFLTIQFSISLVCTQSNSSTWLAHLGWLYVDYFQKVFAVHEYCWNPLNLLLEHKHILIIYIGTVMCASNLVWLVVFYCISTLVGYLMQNPLYIYHLVRFYSISTILGYLKTIPVYT